jgi:hypothetical protein
LKERYMKNRLPAFAVLLLILLVLIAHEASASEICIKTGRFPQKVVFKYPLGGNDLSTSYVSSITICPERVFAGTRDGILTFEDNQFERLTGLEELKDVTRLECAGSHLLAGTSDGLFKVSLIEDMPPRKLLPEPVTALALWNDGCLAGTRKGLFFVKDGAHERIEQFGQAAVTALAAAPDGTVYVGLESGLGVYDGAKATFLYHENRPAGLIDKNIRGLALEDDEYLYIATSKGISRFNGREEWLNITGSKGGLPFEDVLAVAVQGGRLWAGMTIGAARYDGSEWDYLQGNEYLLDDRVNAVAVAPDGSTWLGTPAGITRVEYRMMTLAQKAAHFERATRERHVRHGLVSDSTLARPGDLSTNRLSTSDNDGLWTAMYIAAECYRYGAAGDQEARQFARQSLDALMFLEGVNEIPGFISRSFARPDEPHGKGEWDHITSDGDWRWKGDTSSDEVVGHYYAYSIYYDICAEGDEKEQIREKVRLITDYIMDNDYYLIDTDGQPTTWGKWNFHKPLYRRFRYWDRGLNSLEILSHLKTAFHITGDSKYQDAYMELALEHDYARFTVRQKINIPTLINHSDDELAFLSYYPLLKYEDDPVLLNYYRKSIKRSWQIEKPERCPLWNFIYGAVMPEGTDFGLEDAVATLKSISLDLVKRDHKNSHRADISLKPFHDRFGKIQSEVVLPPDQRSVMKWNGNPYVLDTGKAGMAEEAGTFWLLPYWMGRYYGFIIED